MSNFVTKDNPYLCFILFKLVLSPARFLMIGSCLGFVQFEKNYQKSDIINCRIITILSNFEMVFEAVRYIFIQYRTLYIP